MWILYIVTHEIIAIKSFEILSGILSYVIIGNKIRPIRSIQNLAPV